MPAKVIDQAELITLATTLKPDGKYRTHQEMATELGVSRSGVTKALAEVPPSILQVRDVNSYRERRADIFAEAQKLILQYITPAKLKQASINQLGTLFGIMYDKEQLERGRATSHTMTVNVQTLDRETMGKLQEAIALLTEKKLIESRKKIPEAEMAD